MVAAYCEQCGGEMDDPRKAVCDECWFGDLMFTVHDTPALYRFNGAVVQLNINYEQHEFYCWMRRNVHGYPWELTLEDWEFYHDAFVAWQDERAERSTLLEALH